MLDTEIRKLFEQNLFYGLYFSNVGSVHVNEGQHLYFFSKDCCMWPRELCIKWKETQKTLYFRKLLVELYTYIHIRIYKYI